MGHRSERGTSAVGGVSGVGWGLRLSWAGDVSPPEDGRDPMLAGDSGGASLVSALSLHGAASRRHR